MVHQRRAYLLPCGVHLAVTAGVAAVQMDLLGLQIHRFVIIQKLGKGERFFVRDDLMIEFMTMPEDYFMEDRLYPTLWS